mmetsp:Transcript_123521/g.214238  ORF Transcript_123521/g.214238 Transcript_123521/m.214238 type:complete len:261 (-) Transcript_123521:485-1267(-)
MEMAVAIARSSLPNQVADSKGGLHWKKGWAAPTMIVPATIMGYEGSPVRKGMPDRRKQPAVMSTAAPVIVVRSPAIRAISVKVKQSKTFENRKMSTSSEGSCPYKASHCAGAVETAKHTKSLMRANTDKYPSCSHRCGYKRRRWLGSCGSSSSSPGLGLGAGVRLWVWVALVGAAGTASIARMSSGSGSGPGMGLAFGLLLVVAVGTEVVAASASALSLARGLGSCRARRPQRAAVGVRRRAGLEPGAEAKARRTGLWIA